MTIRDEWVVLDTNIWVFGLRRQPELSTCRSLLERLNRLRVVLPRQIIRELQSNLTESELRTLFRLINQFPDRIKVQWDNVQTMTIRKYERMGCRRGDAVVAAHLEELDIRVLITENRNFLKKMKAPSFRLLNAGEALAEMEK